MREDLLLRLPTCERWLINCWLLAVGGRLEKLGLQVYPADIWDQVSGFKTKGLPESLVQRYSNY